MREHTMFLVIFFGVLALAVSAPAEPKCHLSQLWRCEEQAVEGVNALPKRSIPHTHEEVEALCRQTEEAISCATQFRDTCMTPMQKELLQYVTEGMLSGQEELCDPESETHQNYMEHASCLNEVSHMEEVKSELEYILAVMEKAEEVELAKRITFSCCAYAQTYDTFLTLGREHCGKDATDAIENIINLGVAQLPEILCNGFDAKEERCESLLPPLGAKPQGNVRSPVLEVLKEKFKNWLDE